MKALYSSCMYGIRGQALPAPHLGRPTLSSFYQDCPIIKPSQGSISGATFLTAVVAPLLLLLLYHIREEYTVVTWKQQNINTPQELQLQKILKTLIAITSSRLCAATTRKCYAYPHDMPMVLSIQLCITNSLVMTQFYNHIVLAGIIIAAVFRDDS